MAKSLLLFISLITFVNLFSQTSNSKWKSHFSFKEVTSLKHVDDKIYVATANSIYIHDLNTNTDEVFTSTEGLTGDPISSLFVVDENNLILIGYENGLLQILDSETKEIRTLADINIQTDIPGNPFKINSFHKNEGIIFIATDFGIVEFVIASKTFGDTVKFSTAVPNIFEKITSITTFDNSIFATLGNKEVRQAGLNENLVIESNWSTIPSVQNDSFININDKAYGILKNQIVLINSGTSTPFSQQARPPFSSDIISFTVNRNSATIVTNNEVITLDENLNTQQTFALPDNLKGKITYGTIDGSSLIIAEDNNSLSRIDNNDFDNVTTIGPIGPASNDLFKIKISDGDLWGVYGKLKSNFEPTDNINFQGPSRFRDGSWTNLDKNLFGNNAILVDILINPSNKEEVYFSGFRADHGIYKFISTQLVESYTNDNSNLIKKNDGTQNTTTVTSIEYDNNGNIWAINGETNTFLKQFSTNKNDISDDFHIDLSSFVSSRFNRIGEGIIIDENFVFIGTKSNGIIAYDRNSKTSNNLNRFDEDESVFSSIEAMALDKSSDLWVGSSRGLRIIKEPQNILNNQAKAENIVIEDESGNFQELLFDTRIIDIEVDANNNKWIGTFGSGVFFVSPDGQETFNIFTSSNSPLPSNNINDIAIDAKTGSVFIATEKGLMEYKSDVQVAEADFRNFKIFPNPVRPEYGDVDVQIQGLTAGATVKITDIEGNLVYEIENPVINGSGSGAVTWDTRSFSGRKVASGVYLTLITGKEGEQTKIGKLLIIR